MNLKWEMCVYYEGDAIEFMSPKMPRGPFRRKAWAYALDLSDEAYDKMGSKETEAANNRVGYDKKGRDYPRNWIIAKILGEGWEPLGNCTGPVGERVFFFRRPYVV
jgi:hypothetical protein